MGKVSGVTYKVSRCARNHTWGPWVLDRRNEPIQYCIWCKRDRNREEYYEEVKLRKISLKLDSVVAEKLKHVSLFY